MEHIPYDDVEKIVCELLAEILCLHRSDLTDVNKKIVEDLGADSIDTVDILMDIEDEFNIEVPDEDAAKISTIKDIVDYVNTKIKPL